MLFEFDLPSSRKKSSVYRSLLRSLAHESALLFAYRYTKVRNHIIPEEGRCSDGNSGAGCFLSCSTWHCNSVSDLNALRVGDSLNGSSPQPSLSPPPCLQLVSPRDGRLTSSVQEQRRVGEWVERPVIV